MSHLEITSYSLALILLIILAAFFSCAETALMALNRYRLRHKARLKKHYAIRLLQLLKRPDRILGAILIGGTFANMIASSLATLIAHHFWGDKGALLAAFALTIVVLIFAEITPKTLAAIYPEKIARWVSYPIQFLLKFIYPLVYIANAITNGLLRLFRIKLTSNAIEPLSREELRSMVYDTTGKISRQYQNMLLGILDLSKLTVDDVMIPRNEIMGIDLDLPLDKVTEKIYLFQQEWMPVYQENINQILGILYIKDVLKLSLSKAIITKELLQQYLKEPYFVPEGTFLNVQLDYFQQMPNKVAFVVDEYGEIQGLLTFNDIVDEIIGDFTSNLSPLNKRIHLEADGSYLVEGNIIIREFNRITTFELPLQGPKTINGLITEYLEALPRAGTCILIADYPIEIMQVKNNQVKFAKVFPKLVRSFIE